MINWHILTGEYPPQVGGVSDYTRVLARALVKEGDTVNVYAPPSVEATPSSDGVNVHRLPDHFGPRSFRQCKVVIEASPKPRRILLQYVPQAFGWRGMNLPFCIWLRSQRNKSIWVMFHEVYFPLGSKQSLAHNTLGVVTRVMANLVARSAKHIFVSIPAWGNLLRSLVQSDTPIDWLPIPSSVPVIDAPTEVAQIRGRFTSTKDDLVIGHFGTYGKQVADLLMPLFPQILSNGTSRSAVLLGNGGEAFLASLLSQHPGLKDRIHATGWLPPEKISAHLQACDLLIQPFIDGVSSRRTSVMAVLAHGLPVVTTTGALTEPIWADSRAVALAGVERQSEMLSIVERLLADREERTALAQAGLRLYEERFDIDRTISILRAHSDDEPSNLL